MTPLVFGHKKELQKYLKSHKTARFKAFTAKCDAESFSISMSQNVANTSLNTSIMESEPAPRYHGPSRAIIGQLQRSARNGLLEQYSKLIDENPRCLVTAG